MIEELKTTVINKRAEATRKKRELGSKINEVLEANIDLQKDIKKANKR